jgi:hypothetical protein
MNDFRNYLREMDINGYKWISGGSGWRDYVLCIVNVLQGDLLDT